MDIAENRVAVEGRSLRVSRAAGFWIFGVALLGLLTAAGAPSPLYVVFQQRFGFSSITLTIVFAVYALALLLALVTVGALSDHVGRRPVLISSLLLGAVSMVVFLIADDVAELLVARVLQGIATGVATGTIGAGLVDLAPAQHRRRAAVVNSVAPTAGLAVGGLGAGALAQYAPEPTKVIFALLIALFVALAAVVWLVPETVERRPGAVASMRPRVGVPPAVRPQFRAAAPVLIASWAVGGLYLSLGPTLAGGLLNLHSHVFGGLVVAVLSGAGALTSLLLRDRDPERVMIAGCVALATGTVLSLIALGLASTPLFFAALVVGGVGFGGSFLGAFRRLTGAVQERRAELITAVYVVAYLAFSVPAVIAGLLVSPLGLLWTAVVYGAVVVALALAVLPLSRRRASFQRARAGSVRAS